MRKILSFYLLLTSFAIAQNKQIDSLKNSLKKSSSSKEKAITLQELIDEYFSIDKDSTNYYINQSIKLTKDDTSLNDFYVKSLLKQAQLFIVKGEYKISDDIYFKIWSIIENNYDYELYMKYYGDYGVLNFYKGDFKTAKSYFDKALDLSTKENNEEDQLRFINNKALAMSYLGEAEASLDVHNEGIRLAKKLNDSTALGKSFNNIGLIYEDMKAYQKALEFYLEALKIKENGTSEIDVANSLYNVAGMYKELGEQNKDTTLYTKAEEYYSKAINVAEKNDYGKVILFSKTGIANLFSVREDYQKAIDLYEEIIIDAKTSNDEQTLRVSLLNLGVNYLKIEEFTKAKIYLEESKPLIEKAENPSDLESLYKNLSQLYANSNDYEKAYLFQDKYHTIEKELNKNSLQEKISEFEVKYETEKKENEILQQRTELAEQKNYIILASSLALLAVVIGYLIYSFQRNKNLQLKKEKELSNALNKIETQNKLQKQRLAISQDLHDNIGSQLTFIISSIDNLKFGFADKIPKLDHKLSHISAFTKETIYELRDTIWAMNKDSISVEDLSTRISNFITNANTAANHISFNFKTNINNNDNLSFSSKTGMNVYRIIQEAVNNAVKHSNASKILVEINTISNKTEVSILDNGIGFNSETIEAGNGLNSMKKRATEINADFKIEPLNTGTKIQFVF